MNMLKRILPLLTLLSILVSITPHACRRVGAAEGLQPVERIERKDLKAVVNGAQGEEHLERQIVLGPGLTLLATIDVTSKGNGNLRIGNLTLKVFDSHNDGVFYEHNMLNIEFADIDRDGKRELVISGIVCFTDEKGDSVRRREAVTFIYMLQPNHTFQTVFTNTHFRIDY